MPIPRRPKRTTKPAKQGPFHSFATLIRKRLMTGFLTVLPIAVTLWLVKTVFGLIRDASLWLIEAYLVKESGREYLEKWGYDAAKWGDPADLVKNADKIGELIAKLPPHIGVIISVLAVLLTLFLLYVIGLFAVNLVGRRLLARFDRLIERVPIAKTIYRGTKQILDSFSNDTSENFQRVALIPFPQEHMRCVGFVTSIFEDSVSGEELATVFIPTTPNPTTGYLQILKRKDLVELDWTVEEAMRTIMSGGILKPDYVTMIPSQLPESLPDEEDDTEKTEMG